MRILLLSHVFPPSLGGTETVARLLAVQFHLMGHEVRVVTNTKSDGKDDFPFPVYRRPDALTLLRLTRWCEVFFQNNISLKSAWPLTIVRKPWVIAHHTWIRRPSGRTALRDFIKRALSRHAMNIAVSRVLAGSLPVPARVIGGPYDSNVFVCKNGIERCDGVVCVSRLVSEKGVDLLIDAAGALKRRGVLPSISIVGDGPEKSRLQRQAEGLGLQDTMRFLGYQNGDCLVRLLNQHKILVIPSRCEETFGLAALEGMACGCLVVAAESGGLPEAIGRHGLLFKRGDVFSLAERLELALKEPNLRERLLDGVNQHLAQFKPDTVAGRYLEVFRKTLESKTSY